MESGWYRIAGQPGISGDVAYLHFRVGDRTAPLVQHSWRWGQYSNGPGWLSTVDKAADTLTVLERVDCPLPKDPPA